MAVSIRARHALVETDGKGVGKRNISQQLCLDDIGAAPHDIPENDLLDNALIGVAESAIEILDRDFVISRARRINFRQLRRIVLDPADALGNVQPFSGHAGRVDLARSTFVAEQRDRDRLDPLLVRCPAKLVEEDDVMGKHYHLPF